MATAQTLRTEIEIDGRPAPLVARVNRRAKRLILKVDPAAGEILVTAPSKCALPEAIAFARERAAWIATQLDPSLRAQPFSHGAKIPLRGIERLILNEGGPRAPVRVSDEPEPAIFIGGEPAHLNRRLGDWLKGEARKELTAAVDRYCALLGVKRRTIRIRDGRTRWGSCSSEGSLSFSWRLIMAPPAMLDYVAAHECAHLIHMNHSPAFWCKVRALGVDARAAERWFDAHGATLFAYGASRSR